MTTRIAQKNFRLWTGGIVLLTLTFSQPALAGEGWNSASMKIKSALGIKKNLGVGQSVGKLIDRAYGTYRSGIDRVSAINIRSSLPPMNTAIANSFTTFAAKVAVNPILIRIQAGKAFLKTMDYVLLMSAGAAPNMPVNQSGVNASSAPQLHSPPPITPPPPSPTPNPPPITPPPPIPPAPIINLKQRTVGVVIDYFNGKITKQEAVNAVNAYFNAGTAMPHPAPPVTPPPRLTPITPTSTPPATNLTNLTPVPPIVERPEIPKRDPARNR